MWALDPMGDGFLWAVRPMWALGPQSGEIGENLCDEQKYYHIKIVSESEHDLGSSETAALLVFATFSQQPTRWIKSTSPFRHTTDPKLRMFR